MFKVGEVVRAKRALIDTSGKVRAKKGDTLVVVERRRNHQDKWYTLRGFLRPEDTILSVGQRWIERV